MCVERNSFFFVLKHAEKVLLPSLGSYDFYSHQPDWKMFESRLKSGYVNKQMIYYVYETIVPNNLIENVLVGAFLFWSCH